MIVGFIGKRGSGKTLSMTRECYKYYQKGYKVISNYHLNFSHQLVDFEELFRLAETQADMGNLVLALDEIHILLDSRSGMSRENKVMTFWLNQTRKMNITLLFTTQFLHQVDLRLRSNTDVIVLCDGLTVTKLVDGVRQEFFVCQNEMVFGDEFKRELFVGNDFFKLYETRQVIRFLSRKQRLKPRTEDDDDEG